MKITSITAGWSETISLGNYNNVKPSVIVTAELQEGDNPDVVKDHLIHNCRTTVRNEIDLTLEMHGQAMLYYNGPLFQVLVSARHRLVAILGNRLTRPSDFIFVADAHGSTARALRLERAQLLAADVAARKDYQLFDCTNPDLADINATIAQIEAVWEVIQDAVTGASPDQEGDDDEAGDWDGDPDGEYEEE